ncbi:MAG: rod shape-determining protein MreD [Rikenellaceae bacterium]
MYRRISLYALVFVVVMLLQIFVFDRLTFSVIVAPLVYITFLLLLPTQTPQIEMLFWALFLGVATDFGMGTAGLNTIVTLFLGYTRIYIMNTIFGKDLVSIGGVPTIEKLGRTRYNLYVAFMVFVQLFIYIVFESLSVVSWLLGLQKFIVSGLLSLIFVWLLSYFFGSLLTRKA